jgi:hypothetical protein
MTQPAQGEAPPRKKKGMSGCLIALMVFGGVAFVGILLFAIGMWRALSTPEGQKIVKLVGNTAKLMEEAQNAPGAKEVARRGGCQQALVVDVQRMAELIDGFVADAGMQQGTAQMREKTMITCQVGFARTPPSCETLAETYVNAAHPTDAFRVIVQKQGDTKRVCEMSFDAKGAPIQELRRAAPEPESNEP